MAAGELRVILPPVLIGRTSPENVKLGNLCNGEKK
jgi:hypothetical protein